MDTPSNDGFEFVPPDIDEPLTPIVPLDHDVGMMTMRPYQQECVDAIFSELQANKSTLAVLATGLGKTVIFAEVAYRWPVGRVLIIAHREELIDQAADKVGHHLDEKPAIEMGARKESRLGHGFLDKSKVLVTSVQTMSRENRRKFFNPMDFGLVITDEAHHCHIPGTVVDCSRGYVAIEDIEIGEQVRCLSDGEWSVSRVSNTFRYWYDGLVVELTTSDGMVTVTPNHSMYSEGEKKDARDFRVGDSVSLPAVRMGERQQIRRPDALPVVSSWNEALPGMRCSDGGGRSERPQGDAQVRAGGVFSVPCDASEEVARWPHGATQWNQCDAEQGCPSRGHAEEKCERGVSGLSLEENDREQSNQQSGDCREDGNEHQAAHHSGRDGSVRELPAVRQRREANSSGKSDSAIVPGSNLQSGRGNERQETSVPLQDRRGMAGLQSRVGDRRIIPCDPQDGGRPKDAEAFAAWLDNPQNDERTGSVRESRVISVATRPYRGYVYDIEVEVAHNYIANGLLSSNSTSDSYRSVYEYFHRNPQLRHLGVTATPKRADEAALGDIYQTVAYEMDIREGIDEGYLVDVEQKYVVIEDLDFSQVRTTAGDLNQKDLSSIIMGSEELIAEETPVHKIVSATIQEARGRPTIIFCVTKEHAEKTCEICQRHPGITAEFVTDETDTETRREIIGRFRAGKTQIFCNVGIATEGFDARVDVVAVARPTKSESLYRQMIGRGTRPLPGLVDPYESADERREAIANSAKPTMTVLDFVGASGRHKLVSAVDVLGGQYSEDIIEAAKRRLRECGNAIDIDELLAEEALHAAERKAKAMKLAEEQKARDEAAKQRAEEERKRRAEEWASRKGIRGHATYRTEIVPAFTHVTIPEQVGIGCFRGGATDKQVKFLMKLGIGEQAACKMTVAQAGAVITQRRGLKGGDYVLLCGKYMGNQVKAIPRSYLEWVLRDWSPGEATQEIQRFFSEGK